MSLAFSRHNQENYPMAATSTMTQAHRQAVSAPLSEVASVLQDVLTRRLTAYVVGVKDSKTVSRWASGEITDVRDPAVEQRLRTAYEIARMLLDGGSAEAVRSWFIGLDPLLDDVPPAEAIRDGRLRESLVAARTFLSGGGKRSGADYADRLQRIFEEYPEVQRFGRAVYDDDALLVLLLRPSERFGGLSGLDLLQAGREDEVISLLAADYDGVA
jgi:hypothetical protein